MKQLIFSIYDQKAHAYLPPFFMHTEGMAIRGFADACNDKDHAFGKHPHDYTLFNFGTFNDTTGHFDLKTQGEVLHNGLELVRNAEDEDQPQLPFEDTNP